MTHLGSAKVIANYGRMGLCKAALEPPPASMAFGLGPRNIRVNHLPGPAVDPRRASGSPASTA